MTRRVPLSDEQLRLLLRRGDPAGAAAPEPAELERVRRRVLAKAPTAPEPRFRPAWAIAGALALILVLLAGPETRQPPARPAPEAPHATRQIQFVTAKGTKIFWTLDPNFKL